MLTFLQWINESKQVGDIYHFTNIAALLGILELDGMIAWNIKDYYKNRGIPPHLTNHKYAISFTRNKNLHSTNPAIGGCSCRIKIDGNVLSNNHKLIANADFIVSKEQDESETILLSKLPFFSNIKKYIIQIDIFKNIAENEIYDEPFLDTEYLLKTSSKKTKNMEYVFNEIKKIENQDTYEDSDIINVYIENIKNINKNIKIIVN